MDGPTDKRQNEIFISYSRRDQKITEDIIESLQMHDVDIWFDKSDIPKGVEWWLTIESGILNANAFIFILSLESLHSEVCNWELHWAIQHNKKIIPVAVEDVFQQQTLLSDLETQKWQLPNSQSVSAAENWDTLRRLNIIFILESDTLKQGVLEIIEASRTDLPYLEQHTRFLQRAKEWDDQNRESSFCLGGIELESAEKWISRCSERTQANTASN